MVFACYLIYVKQGISSQRCSPNRNNITNVVVVYVQALSPLTDDQLAVLREIIFWNLQVQWSRAFPYTARDIIVRTVAGTEPTAEITCFADGDTAQMCADAYHDEPFWLLDSFGIGLRVSKGLDSTSKC